MKITVIGTGYVGLVAGTCLADFGNDVICLDVDENKINKLKQGIIPIYEPGLRDMLERNVKNENLSFTTHSEAAIKNSDVLFIAVGTPMGEGFEADLKFVKSVAQNIGKYMNGYKVIVDKSTVPVGTADIVESIIRENQTLPTDFDVVSNPEFLREGEAIKDFTNPDRVVVGVSSERAKEVMSAIYRGIARTDKPIMFTDVKSAEMIKYASNAMLATRISFMNEIAQLCEKVGADVKQVAKGMGLDTRIGPRFLQAGVGYGGSCFPKDVKALLHTMKQNDVQGKILSAVEDVNANQKSSLLPKIKTLLPDLTNKKIAIWGLAFKPKTDDMREAPSITIINQLQREGASIQAYDPEAQDVSKTLLNNVAYCNTPYETLEGCHALIIVTEWNTFRDLDKEKMKSLLLQPNVIDGRNVYDPSEMKAAGFNYIGIGRGK